MAITRLCARLPAVRVFRKGFASMPYQGGEAAAAQLSSAEISTSGMSGGDKKDGESEDATVLLPELMSRIQLSSRNMINGVHSNAVQELGIVVGTSARCVGVRSGMNVRRRKRRASETGAFL